MLVLVFLVSLCLGGGYSGTKHRPGDATKFIRDSGSRPKVGEPAPVPLLPWVFAGSEETRPRRAPPSSDPCGRPRQIPGVTAAAQQVAPSEIGRASCRERG